ncbi:MAG: hypothetical protein IT210_17800 [Armatimonadetes bacterium]|nr:hypothetical protein [Armatimonadota bacterium]
MDDLYLKVFAGRSELIKPGAEPEIFIEGAVSAEARQRYRTISDSLHRGFLSDQILQCRDRPGELSLNSLHPDHISVIDDLVGSMTSEVGRALIGLTVLQLCIKSIEPTQSIRLHKGGSGSRDFSWQEGISMRTLDRAYVTPTLRKYNLLKMNRDGFMMTRSLAENYPYSAVYKAAIRGGRKEWAAIVDAIESGAMPPAPALQYLLSKLLNNADQFMLLAAQALSALSIRLGKGDFNDKDSVLKLVETHMLASDYAARIMEIAMHALAQAMQETGALGNAAVVPLSQMRSANKKHGNIGDIELIEDGYIIEAWDAKYGKTYLRDEMEELADKLPFHTGVSLAGFVTSQEPARLQELEARRHDIAEAYDICLEMLSLPDWVDRQFLRTSRYTVSERSLAQCWITAYVESLAQRRPLVAPIDEPCYQWLDTLIELLQP